MNKEIRAYNTALGKEDTKIANLLMKEIDAVFTSDKLLPRAALGESKVWHGHPVWFIDGNPIVGYSKQKAGMRLMFWSGKDFGEKKLDVVGKNFKDASIFYTSVGDIDTKALAKWLKKSVKIQWDYKNIMKRKGALRKLTAF